MSRNFKILVSLLIGLLCSNSFFAQNENKTDSTKITDIHGQVFVKKRFNLIRYQDKFGYLVNTERANFWENLKFVQLNKKKTTFLSIGGDSRTRLTYISTDNFGSFNKNIEEHIWNQRLMLHTALRNKNYGIFAQVVKTWQLGNKLPEPPVEEDALDLHQLFFIYKFPEASKLRDSYVRLGRQEFFLGSGRLLAIREGANTRLSYDGARADIRYTSWNTNLFYFKEVAIAENAFDNRIFNGNHIYGFYNTFDLKGSKTLSSIDLYYLGAKRDNSFYQNSFGVDDRSTIGTRVVSSPKTQGINFETELNYQFSNNSNNVAAYSATVRSNYSWVRENNQYKIGLDFYTFSGDKSADDDVSNTFYPLNPALGFLGRAPVLGFSNLLAFQPNFRFVANDNFVIDMQQSFVWKHQRSDDLYAPSTLPFTGIYDESETFVGILPSIEIEYALNAFVSFELFYSGLLKSNYFVSNTSTIHNLAFTTYLRF